MSKLLLIADVTATPKGSAVLLSKKFVTGMQMYARHWPGELCAVLQPAELDPENLDVREWERTELGFDLELRSFEGAPFRQWFGQYSPDVVMGGANHLLMDLVAQCAAVDARFVCCTEYSFRTNLQIIGATSKSKFRKLRSVAWMTAHMWQRRNMVRAADALQTNGTPTYEEYLQDTDNALLYFDSRIREDMIVTPAEHDTRMGRLRSHKRPLRLMFSGRLNAMKGADHLIEVAAALRDSGLDFVFDICGDGSLRSQMEARTRSLGLSDHVRFKGVLDFENELIPYARQEVDLFVCCHRQGDPSCTYLETAACGIPLFGYGNEAFTGILRRYRIGVATEMDNPAALAQEIERALCSPEMLEGYAQEGIRFARENTYDRVFGQRIAHLRSVAGLCP